MKIYEIISEAKQKSLSKTMKASAPHAKQYNGIDQYYGMYRFGIAMAGSPDKKTPQEGPAKDVPAVWMYSKGDEDIVNKAESNQGISGKTIVKQGPSEELKSVNKVSPVPARKTNKYGV